MRHQNWILFVFIIICGIISCYKLPTKVNINTSKVSTDTGEIPAHFGVDQNGGAVYSIKLDVPPGIQSVEPKLALTYHSQHSNGTLGVGWNLSGVSAIERTPEIIAIDGVSGGINFDDNDRLSLDGERLICIEGTYNDANALYHTELESWQKVEAIPDASLSGSPQFYYRVTNKKGIVKTYGRSSGRILTPSNEFVRVWALDSIVDLNGNYMVYDYSTENGQFYIDSISYGLNTASSSSQKRSIRFNYETRSDVSNQYIGGFLIQTSKRLNNITTYINSTDFVSSYNFYYQDSPSTNRTLMTEMQLCQSTADDCLPPTTFKWQGEALAFNTSVTNSSPLFNGENWINRTLADVNGDGLEDLVAFINGGVQVALATYGSTTYQDTTQWISGFTGTAWANKPRWVIDINGDGKSDIVGINSDGVSVAISTGDAFDTSLWEQGFPHFDGTGWGTSLITMADVNGDGKSDIVGFNDSVYVAISGTNSFVSYSGWFKGFSGTAWDGQPRLLTDVNGDKKADIVGFGKNDTGVIVALSKGTYFDTDGWEQGFSGFNDQTVWGGASRMLGDMNGDGLMDLVGITQKGTVKGVNVAYSSGKGFETLSNWSDLYSGNGWGGSSTPISLSDFNQDGLTDVIGFNGDGITIGISSGTGIEKVIGPILTDFDNSNYTETDPRVTADINGDGLPDILGFNNTGVNTVLNLGPVPDLIDTIQNGIGTVIALQYEPISNPEVYSGTDALSHFQSINKAAKSSNIADVPAYNTRQILGGNRYVMAAYTQSYTANPSTEASFNYAYLFQYANAEISLDGRGWLGFESKNKTDINTGALHIKKYLQHFPYTGRVAQSQSQCDPSHSTDPDCKAGAILSQIDYAYYDSTSAWYNPFPKVYQVFKKSTIQSFYDYGAYNFSIGDLYEYDVFGNIFRHSYLGYVNQDGTDQGTTDNVYTLRYFDNDTLSGEWLLGYRRVTKVSTKSDTTGLSSISIAQTPAFDSTSDFSLRTTTYTADNRMNIAAHNNWDDGIEPNAWLSSKYDYDGFGNQTISITPAGDTTITIFESVYNTFPDSMISPPNTEGKRLVNYFGFDPRFGTAVASTDDNNNVSITLLDPYGRKAGTQGPVPDITGIKASANQVSSYVTGSFNFKAAAVVTLSTQSMNTDSLGMYVEKQIIQNWPTGANDEMQWHKFYHDGLGRVFKKVSSGSCEDQGDIISDNVYNAQSQVVKSTLPYYEDDEVYWQQNSYDIYGRVTKTIQPAGPTGQDSTVQIYTYTGTDQGITMSKTTAPGTSIAYTQLFHYAYFQGKRKLVQMVVPDNNNATTTYGYDQIARSTSATDPATTSNPNGLTNTVKYDSRGREIALFNPAQGSMTFSYDQDGKLESKRDSNGITSFQYDKMDRTLKKTLPDGTVIVSTYDDPNVSNSLGMRTGVEIKTANDSTIMKYNYAYDKYGNVNQTVLAINGKSYKTEQILDPRGRVLEHTYPDGTKLTNTYSACHLSNQAIANSDMITYTDYTALGAPQTISYANSVVNTFEYNPTGNLTRHRITNGDGTNLLHDSLAWDQLNQITSINDLLSDTVDYSQSFTYNNLRLMQATATGTYGTKNYNYDESGNLTLKDSIDFKYQGHQAISGTKDGQQVFSAGYKMMGNMSIKILTGDTTTFQYNSQNRLITATKAGKTNQYVYNHLGQRILKIKSDGTQVLYVNKYYEETTNSAKESSITKYVVGPQGKMVAITENAAQSASSNSSLYFHRNYLSSTILVTDASGAVKNRPIYLPYGGIFTLNGPNDFRPKYTGKELDDDIGIYYYNARYHDPSLGRFITADNNLGGHKSQQDVFNRYEYVLGNPVKYNDPTGHNIPCYAVGAIAGGTVAVLGVASTVVAHFETEDGLSNSATIGATGTIILASLTGTAAGWGLCNFAKARAQKGAKAAAEKADERIARAARNYERHLRNKELRERRAKRAEQRDEEKIDDDSNDEGDDEGCFTAGTLISTKTGLVKIENIQIGDSLWSYNEAIGTKELKPVKYLIRKHVGQLVILHVNDQVIETTAEHPFWIECKGWVEAAKLEAGNELTMLQGGKKTIRLIEYKKGHFPVFNFEVEKNHSYYVSRDAFLVHNATQCGNNGNDSASDNGTSGKATNADDTPDSGAEGESSVESATDAMAESTGEVAGETTGEAAGEVAGEAAGEVAGEVVGEVAAAGFIESVLLPVLESLAFLLLL